MCVPVAMVMFHVHFAASFFKKFAMRLEFFLMPFFFGKFLELMKLQLHKKFAVMFVGT